MIIRILLILGTCIALLWFLSRRQSIRSMAWGKLAAIAFFAAAIVAVLFPQLTTKVAHVVGVGRGADLVLYCLVVAFLFFVVQQYVQRSELEQKFIRLSRKIAIVEANQNPHNLALLQKVIHSKKAKS